MCGIWKTSDHVELAPAHYSKLPKTLHTLNISGGEPFIRDDLVEIVRVIHARLPDARLVFSTNGLMTEAILLRIGEILEFHERVGVGVSVDGCEKTHDQIRGVNGIYKNAIRTVEGLKEIGISDLRLGMTIQPENINEVREVFRLSRVMGVEFTTTVAHNSEIYFGTMTNETRGIRKQAGMELAPIIHAHLGSKSPKDWARAYHMEGISSQSIREGFSGNCLAGQRYFFMNPRGDVYPCMVLDWKLGNISEIDSWEQMFPSDKLKEIKRVVQSCHEDCWMVCNTRSLIMSHPFKAGMWLLRRRLPFFRDSTSE